MITGTARSDRGFGVILDRNNRRVLISFDHHAVAEKHTDWLRTVKERVGLGELSPQPYWGFNDLGHKAGTKLLNCFYVQARTKREEGREFFCYENIFVLTRFSISAFIDAIEKGHIYVDFDARTHHNHGTKFRLRQDKLTDLYESVQSV